MPYYNNENLMRNTIENEEEKCIMVMRIQGEMWLIVIKILPMFLVMSILLYYYYYIFIFKFEMWPGYVVRDKSTI